jgi:hypothetical protein
LKVIVLVKKTKHAFWLVNMHIVAIGFMLGLSALAVYDLATMIFAWLWG